METRPDLTGARWRKSSYSGTNGGDCVEVAEGWTGAVPVRDSKQPLGPVLIVTTGAWRAFVAGLR
ncbi:DUF397 domain-containing protein [Streptomyces sp. NPDC101158]|uniref:DUF397 domain-containing protein n=1 Tax=Streptomyces sp. NPDC101158 TaxID=3366117 RepID=UPI003806AD12